MTLTEAEQELFDSALNVSLELAMSEHEQHKGLGQIIAGLCAIIYKRQIMTEAAKLTDGESGGGSNGSEG